jgi:hypothetical protein
MRRTARIAAWAVVAGCLTVTGTAAATEAKAPVMSVAGLTLAPAATFAAPPGAPAGYVVVRSPFGVAPSGRQTQGVVGCPTGTVVLGGGLSDTSAAVSVNVNSSYPASAANGWIVDVNNVSGVQIRFAVYAVCATRPAGYAIVVDRSNPTPGGQWHAEATCPGATLVVGGGAYSSSGDAFSAVNMNTTVPLPSSRSWRVDMDNGTGASATMDNYAICMRSPRYQPVFGPTVVAAAGAHQVATATCPSGTVPAGGGAFANLASTSLNIGSTFPLTQGWRSFVNNASTQAAGIRTDVICIGRLTQA